VVLLNVQTVKDMGVPKIIAISNWDMSNVQVITWQTSATEHNDLVMSDVSSVEEIILLITRDVWCTNIYTTPTQIKHTPHTQPGVTYAQITKQNSYAPPNIEQEPHTIQPYQQTSNIQDLHDEKPFWANGNYAKPPHNRAY
jgi:hypothetical protein